MNCERASENYSDYIEGSLDRRAALAMEAHLAACARCTEEVDGLRQTWADLSSLPTVQPPPGLAEQTIAAIQRELGFQRKPVSRRTSWVGWLHSLTPARVAFATSLATLIIAGAILFPTITYQGFGWLPWFIHGPEARQAPSPPAPDVTLTVVYGPATNRTEHIDVIVQANQNLPQSDVEVRRVDSGEIEPAGRGTLLAGTRFPLPVILPRRAAPEDLIVTVVSRPVRLAREFYCAVPLERANASDLVSIRLVETPLRDAVNQLAEKTGHPVVMDASLAPTPVSADVSDRPAADAWSAVLRPLRLRAVNADGTYRIVPAW